MGGAPVRKRMSIAAASAVVALALAVASPVAAAGALDQHQDGHGNMVAIPGGAPVAGAQTFTANVTGNLDQVALYVGIGQAPQKAAPAARLRGMPLAPGDNISVAIFPTSGGLPDMSSEPLGTATAQAPALDFAWVNIAITPPVPVVSGHVYVVIAMATPSGSALGWGGSCDANPYPNGAPFLVTPGLSTPLGSGSIETCIQDLAFRTYVTRGATPPPTGTAESKTPAPTSHLPLIFAAFAVGAAFVTVRKAAEARRSF
jgi:hypothetical protein